MCNCHVGKLFHNYIDFMNYVIHNIHLRDDEEPPLAAFSCKISSRE
jgi:hypothetical protein